MAHLPRGPFGLGLLSHLSFPHKIGILERLYGRKLSALGHCWVNINPDLQWKLDLTDATQRWIVYDSYENKFVTRWIRSLFKQGGVAVESGSNTGQTLLYYADIADKILAIDPLQSALDWLSDCIERNGLKNIELIHAGICDQRSRLKLQQAGARSTFRADWYKTKGYETVEIDCYPLDEIAHRYRLDHIRFWKLDVEGMEYQALQGAHNLLSGQKIDAMYIEITGGNFDKVAALLNNHGYGLYLINKNLTPSPVNTPIKDLTDSYICLPDK